MRYEVLGPIQVHRGETRVLVSSGTQRRILAALLTRTSGRISTVELVDALWPDDPPANAAKNVQSYVAKLKHLLAGPGEPGGSVIASVPNGYTLRIRPGDVDAQEFTDNIRRARAAHRAGDSAIANVLLDRGLRSWRGRPYSDLQDWPFLQPEIERLEQRRLEAFELGIELGRHADLLPELTSLADENPYQERPVGLLMRALYALGRQAEAQEAYHRTRTRLADDLGIDPTAGLQELYQAMLRGDAALTASDATSGSGPAIADVAEPLQERRVVVVDGMPQPPKAYQKREALRALEDHDRSAVVCSVTGARGVGKTQLVAAYARSRIAQGWTVVWVDAESREPLVSGLANLAEVVGLRTVEQDSVHAAGRARRWLSELETPGLLVLDNATNPDLVREWLPPAGAVQVVVTSNRRVFGWLGEHIELDVFTTEQARRFLTECTGLPANDATDQIADAVGHYALALALAAAVISRERIGYRDYLERFAALPVDQVLTAHEGDPYPRSVGDAIRLSLDAVEPQDPNARSLAELLAVLSPRGASRSLLIPDNTDEDPKAARSRILALLVDASLLTYGQDGQTVIMHRLTGRVVRERAARESRLNDAVAEATQLLDNRFRTIGGDRTPVDRNGRKVAAEILGHLETLTSVIDSASSPSSGRIDSGALLELCEGVIQYFHDRHEFILVHALERSVLSSQERALGPEHPQTLRSRVNLALEYRRIGRVNDAILLLEQIVDNQHRALGGSHPDTLKTRYHLAATHLTAGHAAQAISLLEQLVIDQEHALGPDHLSLLTTRKRLAWAYRSLGRLDIATASYDSVIVDLVRVVGPEHPQTLRARSELACVHRAAGRLDDAISLLEHNLADRERVFGAGHTDAVGDRDRLAGAYRAIGRSDDAIGLFEQTLNEWERLLGTGHPWTLMARNNLACAHESAGHLDVAIAMLEQTRTEHEQVLGPGLPRTLNVRNNLACAYHVKGRTSEAIALFEQTLADRISVLGNDHPDTFTSRQNLAVAYDAAGRTDDAARVRPLGESGSGSGTDHPPALWQRNSNAYAAGHSVDETVCLSASRKANLAFP